MRVPAAVLISALLVVSPALAQPVADSIEAAKQAYGKGELLKAAGSLQAALDAVHESLGKMFLPLMPAAPAGWQSFDAQADTMGIAGGGMTVMKGYEKGEASINASIILDQEAVSGIADILANPAAIASQPGMTKVTLPDGPALMRWDAEDKSGEIMLVIGDSLLLQIVGNGIDKSDILVDMMKKWNVGAIRKQVGM